LLAQFVDSGQVLFAFRHLPLPIHKNARRIAEAAVCADEQGRFWDFQDEAFRTDMSPDSVSTITRKLGLRDQPYNACLAGRAKARVDADLAQARELNITGTPAFLIGERQSNGQVKVTQRLNGAVPLADFENAIKQALTAAQPR
jgi:protein-disulfide isomerase